MVYKSAYQRYYRSPKWDDFSVEEYKARMNYRQQRRSVEHRHEPWLWESDIEDNDIEEIESARDADKVAELPTTPPDVNKTKPVEAWLERKEQREDSLSEHKREEVKNKHKSMIKADATYKVKSDQARPNRERKQRSPERVKKRETRRRTRKDSPSRDIEDKRRNPPFLPYGWANDGPVEYKKTHNVLASEPEVFPAALRAAKRRQQGIKQKTMAHEEAIRKREIVPPAVVDEPFPYYPKGLWMTEYQRNFCRQDDVKKHFFR
ncbi:centriole, cilia and spindle-associated protein [Nematostella vectensis]|uniref:centriole, cilia and spindle-associated protein n=1 Tax=Nematostella vectensis TaxID=45351 RepID=UPI0020770237|nr:centriole, cilia and spindle-associated protein [Nematostella vectensis]